MTEEKRKAFEQEGKTHKEMENAALRIVWFILEDEKMRKTTPGHIKDILDKASGIISKVAECITLEQLRIIFEQIFKDSSPKNTVDELSRLKGILSANLARIPEHELETKYRYAYEKIQKEIEELEKSIGRT